MKISKLSSGTVVLLNENGTIRKQFPFGSGVDSGNTDLGFFRITNEDVPNVSGIKIDPTKITSTIIDGEETPFTGGINDLALLLATSFFSTVGGSGSTNATLAVDSKILWFGHSLIAHGFTILNGNYYYLADGYATQAMMANGYKYYQPINGNQGVAGNNTTQMIARLGAALALRPKVVVMQLAINDIVQNTPIATIRANRYAIINAFKAIGAKVILVTDTKTFTYNGGTALTAPQEIVRATLRTEALQMYADKVIDGVVDGDKYVVTQTDTNDGLHYITAIDEKFGTDIASILNKWVSSNSVGYQIYPESVNNYLLAGGTTMATGWSLNNFLVGASVVASKGVNSDGSNYQKFVLSGNYTGNSTGFQMKQDFTTSLYKSGDIVEAICEFEVITPLINVNSVQPQLQVWTAGFGVSLALTTGDYPTATEGQTFLAGKYVFKSPSILITGGTPAILTNIVYITLKDVGAVSTPVSGEIRILRLGSRKVPQSLELDK